MDTPSHARRRLSQRSRDIDGAYFIETGGAALLAHFEFHRRHQSAAELGVDVAEAQVRLHRREGLEVVSLVWDLYGAGDGARILTDSSRVVYLRVNLHGLAWKR